MRHTIYPVYQLHRIAINTDPNSKPVLFSAHDLGLLQAIGEQPADYRRGGAQVIKGLIDHDDPPFSELSQVHPVGQHTAGGDGGQLGLGTVTAGDQDNRDLGTQDDACVFGAAKERGSLANAIAHLIVGYQQDIGLAGAGG
mgnify:CR=1 FL=1